MSNILNNSNNELSEFNDLHNNETIEKIYRLKKIILEFCRNNDSHSIQKVHDAITKMRIIHGKAMVTMNKFKNKLCIRNNNSEKDLLQLSMMASHINAIHNIISECEKLGYSEYENSRNNTYQHQLFSNQHQSSPNKSYTNQSYPNQSYNSGIFNSPSTNQSINSGIFNSSNTNQSARSLRSTSNVAPSVAPSVRFNNTDNGNIELSVSGIGTESIDKNNYSDVSEYDESFIPDIFNNRSTNNRSMMRGGNDDYESTDNLDVNKKTLIFFKMKGCIHCAYFEKKWAPLKEKLKRMGVQTLEYDIFDNDPYKRDKISANAQRIGVKTFPTVIFFNGKSMNKINHGLGVDEIIQQLQL